MSKSTTAWLLAGCLLAAPAWAGDEGKSFSVGLQANERATLADVGLPAYPGAVPCFTTYEARVEHVPMDDDGLRVDLVEEALGRLAAEGRPPKLLYTIPNFHNPAGVTMALERRERLIEDTSDKRAGTPGDVAATLHWLASPGASHVTSQVVQVNGGAERGH